MKFVRNALLSVFILSSAFNFAMEEGEDKEKKISYKQLVLAVSQTGVMKPSNWQSFENSLKKSTEFTKIKETEDGAQILQLSQNLTDFINDTRPLIDEQYWQALSPKTGFVALGFLTLTVLKHASCGLLDWVPSEGATLATGGFWAGRVSMQLPQLVRSQNASWAVDIVEDKVTTLLAKRLYDCTDWLPKMALVQPCIDTSEELQELATPPRYAALLNTIDSKKFEGKEKQERVKFVFDFLKTQAKEEKAKAKEEIADTWEGVSKETREKVEALEECILEDFSKQSLAAFIESSNYKKAEFNELSEVDQKLAIGAFIEKQEEKEKE